jgi:hypothetical protein
MYFRLTSFASLTLGAAVAVALGAAATGCGTPSVAAVAPPSLASPVRVAATQVLPDSRVTIFASGGFQAAPSDLNLGVRAFNLELDTGASPHLSELMLGIGDIDVPASALPPNGLKLRDLSLSVARPVRATIDHAEDNALEAHAQSPLTLDWSMVLDDGTLHELGAIETEPVDLRVEVYRDTDGATYTAVHASCPGECWSLRGIAELRDGTVYAEATAAVTATH